MKITPTYFFIKLLNLLPKPFLKKIAYTKIGSKIVNIIKKRDTKSKNGYDIGYGLKMYLDLAVPHTWDLILGTDGEKEIKDIFFDHIKIGDVVIDIGANIGEYSLIASKKVGPSGIVICIEPIKESSFFIRKNFELNGSNNYLVLQIAVGDKPGKMILYRNLVGSYGFLDPILEEKQLSEATEIEVETIDNIVTSRNIQKIGMMKIDVEGHEYEVLLGCKESFNKNRIQNIICEIHPNYLKKKGISVNRIYDLLKENGFSIDMIRELDKTLHILACNTKN